jgi:Amt family ammonium transporter
MIPGIDLFYAGMTKRKSALSLLWLSFMAMAVTSFQVCILITFSDYK